MHANNLTVTHENTIIALPARLRRMIHLLITQRELVCRDDICTIELHCGAGAEIKLFVRLRPDVFDKPAKSC